MKVSELTGSELDAWVAKAEGYVHLGAIGVVNERVGPLYCMSGQNDWWKGAEGKPFCGPCEGVPFRYSTEWERGGPIVECEKIDMRHRDSGHFNGAPFADKWFAARAGGLSEIGDTPLIAAMRCYVASKFGDTVPPQSTVRQDEQIEQRDK